MAPQAPWSPTAHAFAQFSHVANFCPASYRLEALPDGRAELSLKFQLPQASEVVLPPSHVFPVPPPQRPIPPLFPGGCFPNSLAHILPKESLSKAAQKPAALGAASSCLGCAFSPPSKEWLPTTGCSSLCSVLTGCFSLSSEHSKCKKAPLILLSK